MAIAKWPHKCNAKVKDILSAERRHQLQYLSASCQADTVHRMTHTHTSIESSGEGMYIPVCFRGDYVALDLKMEWW